MPPPTRPVPSPLALCSPHLHGQADAVTSYRPPTRRGFPLFLSRTHSPFPLPFPLSPQPPSPSPGPPCSLTGGLVRWASGAGQALVPGPCSGAGSWVPGDLAQACSLGGSPRPPLLSAPLPCPVWGGGAWIGKGRPHACGSRGPISHLPMVSSWHWRDQAPGGASVPGGEGGGFQPGADLSVHQEQGAVSTAAFCP